MPKNIMICFDGTKNDPEDAKQQSNPFQRDQVEDRSITNVLKLHLMFGGNLNNTSSAPGVQHSFYYPGVGTYGNKLRKLFNAALALPNSDIRSIIQTARADLKKIYQKGDQIFIFGFSRGAAIARKFAFLIHTKPIEYLGVQPAKPVVSFLGVFDTVASIGLPSLSDDKMPKYDVKFQGGHTVSAAVSDALHILSIDENRTVFKPTLMNAEARVNEVWFPGVHSDIGGGYWKDHLSDVTLDFMLKYMMRKNFPIKLTWPDQINYAALVAQGQNFSIDRDDLNLNASVDGVVHKHNRGLLGEQITLDKRNIHVLVNDNPSADIPPLVFAGVAERIKNNAAYNPPALRKVAHRLIDAYGVITKDSAGKDRVFTGTRNYF